MMHRSGIGFSFYTGLKIVFGLATLMIVVGVFTGVAGGDALFNFVDSPDVSGDAERCEDEDNREGCGYGQSSDKETDPASGDESDDDSGSGDGDGGGTVDPPSGDGPSGPATVTEVCTKRVPNTITADEIDLGVTIQTNADSGDFQVRIRPPPGIAHKILPCTGAVNIMCSNTNKFKSLEQDTSHTFTYNSGGADTNSYGHFNDGFRVQLRLDSTDNQIDEVELTDSDVASDTDRQCVDFSG